MARADVPKGGWRLTGSFAEDSVKMGQRLEPDGVRNLTDTEVRIQQEILCPLHSDAPEIVGEGQAGSLPEEFTKIEGAHMHCARDLI